jgi:ABC-2 type transport system permease protein
MNRMLTLVRREFWEHRGLFWAPLITAGLLVLATFLGGSRGGAVRIAVDGKTQDFIAAMSGPAQEKFFGVFLGALIVPQLVVALVVVFFYLLDALYSERRDRSILFWKSMPVSDTETVASKALVALLLVPLWVWLLSLAVGVLGFGALALKVSGTPFASLATWHMGSWLAVQGTLLLNTLVAALWYAPVAAALLVLSAFARRAVFMWAVLPPLVLIFLEKVAFNTGHVAAFIGRRLSGFFEARGEWVEPAASASAERKVAAYTELYDRISALPLLSNPELWAGVVVAVALFYVAVRLRRWRDDT